MRATEFLTKIKLNDDQRTKVTSSLSSLFSRQNSSSSSMEQITKNIEKQNLRLNGNNELLSFF